jgi:hypothetical protein
MRSRSQNGWSVSGLAKTDDWDPTTTLGKPSRGPAQQHRLVADAAIRIAKAVAAAQPPLPDWPVWLAETFGAWASAPMAPRHVALWDWFEALTQGSRPRPRVEVWPRGGGKSTTVELALARMAQRRNRRYVLYVCATQSQANHHAQSIAALLGRAGVQRAINAYGSAVGWRHEELRTGGGWNLTAFGLDAAVRGVKIDQFRPDLVVFDDVDDRGDSALVREKKIDAITSSILPALAGDAAVLVIQNLVDEESIVARLARGDADFLVDREIGSQDPAVRGLVVERRMTPEGARYRIAHGEATWAGQSLAVCEQQIHDWGLSAFRREAQHDLAADVRGLWTRDDIESWRVHTHPPLAYVVVGLDPSATATGDEAGIIVAGRDARGEAYVLADRSLQGTPKQWAETAVAAARQYGARLIVAESNQGGQMVGQVISSVPGAPPVRLVHVSDGKRTRAEPIQKRYSDAHVHHVGSYLQLEREMTRWVPGMPSPNRLDALVLALTAVFAGRTSGGVVSGPRPSSPTPVGLHRPDPSRLPFGARTLLVGPRRIA